MLLSLNKFVRLLKDSPSSDSYRGDDVVFNSGFATIGGGLLTSMRAIGADEEDGGIHDVDGGGIIVLKKSGSGGRGSSGGGGGGAIDGSGGSGSAKLNGCGVHIDSDGGGSKRAGPGTDEESTFLSRALSAIAKFAVVAINCLFEANGS